MSQCGRVEPVIQRYISIKFVGEDEEKYGLKDWKRCAAECAEGSHVCAEHAKNPIGFKSGETTVNGKVVETFTPFHPSMLDVILAKK